MSKITDDQLPKASYVGLTGFLTPKGEFYECPYMQHIAFSEKLYYIEVIKDKSLREKRERHEHEELFLNRMGYVAMGSKGWQNMSHIRFPSESYYSDSKSEILTIEQIQWFAQNFDRLDEEQQLFVARYMHLYVGTENGIDDEVEEQFGKLYMNKYPQYFQEVK
jgi:hypothetical protein